MSFSIDKKNNVHNSELQFYYISTHIAENLTSIGLILFQQTPWGELLR